MHVRTQIRHKVEALLRGLPTTANNVFRGRKRALGKDHAPCLLVYTEDEPVTLSHMGNPAAQDRIVMLLVEGRATGSGTDSAALEDLLDAIAAEVETRILQYAGFDGLAQSTELAMTRTRVEAPGEGLVGAVRLEFRVAYQTPEGVPTTAL